MHFLVLCILCSTTIFVIFKSLDRQRIPSLPIIVINYLMAAILGFVINSGGLHIREIREADWLPVSALIGILFIIMFFLIAFSSRKAGISITTVASKMSVIFPILFSIVIDSTDKLTLLKIVAIASALAGVALTVYKPKKGPYDSIAIYIPLILFFGMGMVELTGKICPVHICKRFRYCAFQCSIISEFLPVGFGGNHVFSKNSPHFSQPFNLGMGHLTGSGEFWFHLLPGKSPEFQFTVRYQN